MFAPKAALGSWFGFFTLVWSVLTPYSYPIATDLFRWPEVTESTTKNQTGIGFNVNREDPLLKTIAVTTLFRSLENLFLVVVIPHGGAFCEFVERCEPGRPWGHAHGSIWARWGLRASTLIVTSSMLLCQSIILNRSHLYAVATVSGEWRAIDDEVRAGSEGGFDDPGIAA